MAASHQTHHAQVQSLAISQDETLLVRINVMKFYLLSKNNSRSALEDLKISLWFVQGVFFHSYSGMGLL